MSEQAFGVLVGSLCAVVLTPLVTMLWKRLAPPTLEHAADLSAEGWRRSDGISKESVIVTALAGALFVGYVGFGTAVDGVAVVMVISGIFGIPTGWILLRCRMSGPSSALDDFANYFEKKYGISFKSWLHVGIPALAVSAACLVAFLSGQQ